MKSQLIILLMLTSLVSIGQVVRLNFREVRDNNNDFKLMKDKIRVIYNLDEKILFLYYNDENGVKLDFLNYEIIENKSFGKQTLIYAKEKKYNEGEVGFRCSLLFTNIIGKMVLDYDIYDEYGKKIYSYSCYE